MSLTKDGLHVGRGLWLPREYALERNAILAVSGAGKSNVGMVLFEEMHDAAIPAVTIDPKGDWWGARANAEGDGPGLSVPVFGGEHGDLPLEPTAGKLMAQLVAEKRLSCIIDVSGEEFTTRAQMYRFLNEFATTLLRVNHHPLHVFAEECDDYIPQAVRGEGGDAAKCLGAWQRLVKRGRQRGIGVTLISQRSAAVNKDALNQIQTLLVLRTTASRDITAVKEWIVGPPPMKATPEEEEILGSLRHLSDGEAWLVSPEWLKRRDRVRFRRRRTFDSGAAPTLGEAPIVPTTLADIDLKALGSEIADSIERAKADDPDELRQRIAGLTTEVNGRGNRIAQLTAQVAELERRPPEAEPVEIPVVPAWLPERLDAFAAALQEDAEQAMAGFTKGLEQGMDGIREAATKIAEEAAGKAVQREQIQRQAQRRPTPSPPSPVKHADGPAEPVPLTQGDGPPRAPRSGAPHKVLAALALFPGGRAKRQLGSLAGVPVTKSTFRAAMKTLVAEGYVEVRGDLVMPTPAGLSVAGGLEPPPRGPALINHWRKVLGDSAARRCFDALVRAHPGSHTKAGLAKAAAVDGESTMRAAITKLRNHDLIDDIGAGGITAAAELMEAVR